MFCKFVVVPDNFFCKSSFQTTFLQVNVLMKLFCKLSFWVIFFANLTNCFRTTILQIVVQDKVVANFAHCCSRLVWLGRRGGQSSQVGLGGRGGEGVRLVTAVWSA